MPKLRFVPVIAAAAVVLSSLDAQAASRSRIDCLGNLSGIKTISPESTTDVGPPQNDPFAIVRIISARLVISDPIAGGLIVTKSTLSHAKAFGEGRPNGYTGGGPLNPSGPWVGMQWPYRDFADGYAGGSSSVPLGNDIGTITQPGAGTFVIDNIAGAMSYATTSPASYMRGSPGNGVTDFTQFFSVDLNFTNMAPRNVVVSLENVQLQVLVRNRETGQFSLDTQSPPNERLVIEVPAPASAGLLALGSLPLLSRRRRAM